MVGKWVTMMFGGVGLYNVWERGSLNNGWGVGPLMFGGVGPIMFGGVGPFNGWERGLFKSSGVGPFMFG